MKKLTLALSLLAAPLAAQDINDAKVLADLRACYDGAGSADGKRACIGEAGLQCQDETEGGYSTLGQSMCQMAEARAWDVILNEEYRAAMEMSKSFDEGDRAQFPEFTHRAETLRAAQRAWIPYRDALCAAEYAKWGAGSMRNIAGSACKVEVIANRAIDLWNMYGMME